MKIDDDGNFRVEELDMYDLAKLCALYICELYGSEKLAKQIHALYEKKLRHIAEYNNENAEQSEKEEP